jgi:hypothetical protein
MKNLHWQFKQTFVRGSILLIGLLLTIGSVALAQATQTPAKDKPYVVEYYYKAQWGHADEFLQLYKKNHYPVMKKEQELGRIISISMVKPRLHATEEGRWDFRVTIVWKSVKVTDDGFDEDKLIRQMYPNQESYKKEEQRRFEILLAHWDVPVVDVVLEN